MLFKITQSLHQFLKINRPLTVFNKNTLDITVLTQLAQSCTGFTNATTFKAFFLTAFFYFFRLSNLAPHTVSEFDPSRHFTVSDFYTFHAFRRSGATLAYRAHVPIQGIKDHSTWKSDCVWRYIQSDESKGLQVAQTFRDLLL